MESGGVGSKMVNRSVEYHIFILYCEELSCDCCKCRLKSLKLLHCKACERNTSAVYDHPIMQSSDILPLLPSSW